jgi:hypothetical protein
MTGCYKRCAGLPLWCYISVKRREKLQSCFVVLSMATWIVRSDADRNKDGACPQDYRSSVSHFLHFIFKHTSYIGHRKRVFCELCGWICGELPIVTLCIISGGCRQRRNLPSRSSWSRKWCDQNANSHPCYIKPMLNTKPLAEEKELDMAERLFSRDLRFSQRRCWRL